MTLTEFLLARIAEDEEDALDHYSNHEDGADVEGAWCIQDHGDTHPCAYRRRMLAECEAKRRIVQAPMPGMDGEWIDGWWDMQQFALRVLTLLYADHADYREEWRP